MITASVARAAGDARFVPGVLDASAERDRTDRHYASRELKEKAAFTILVSPFARPSWLDRYRGLFLLLDGLDEAGRAELIDLLKRKVAP